MCCWVLISVSKIGQRPWTFFKAIKVLRLTDHFKAHVEYYSYFRLCIIFRIWLFLFCFWCFVLFLSRNLRNKSFYFAVFRKYGGDWLGMLKFGFHVIKPLPLKYVISKVSYLIVFSFLLWNIKLFYWTGAVCFSTYHLV